MKVTRWDLLAWSPHLIEQRLYLKEENENASCRKTAATENYMREITLVISLHTAAISCGIERKSLKEMLDSISFKQHR